MFIDFCKMHQSLKHYEAKDNKLWQQTGQQKFRKCSPLCIKNTTAEQSIGFLQRQ